MTLKTLPPNHLPMWRSLLFVPVTVRKFVEGAAARGADGIILDLEDSIPAADKPRARTLIEEAAAIVGAKGADVTVRINRPWRETMRDLEAAVSPRIKALLLPKIDSADHVRMIAEVVEELEIERGMAVGSTQLVAMVETAAAFFRVTEIAAAHPRVVAITLGSEDFALSAGILPEAEALLYPKQQIVFAARAAGVLPLGFVGTVADFRDLDTFRQVVRRSRRLGFVGASVIHPGQIAILNEEFRPTRDEVEGARRVVAAYEAALDENRGAIVVDGKMVDVPIVERARSVLAREAAIAARESRG
jgi:citrate lyase subunit beta/citryl-CoA lyase